ncbi:MAG: hypothetical protein NC831_08190 [Candidatus Omnitrophica bacterium]|nr:hypothetical protein [Candidatus Omnitrophota bacterium]
MSKFKIFFLGAAFIFLNVVFAAQNIECTASSVDTELSDDGEAIKTVFEGNVRVVINDIAIECERAIIDHKLNLLTIDTGLKFFWQDISISSERVSYNFQSEKGEFNKTKFVYAPFFGKSDIVKKETDTISMNSCMLTTCDAETPHYHLFCGSVRLSQEKFIIRNLKIYLGRVPVFYFPGYSYNLKTRKPPFSISVGYETELGNGISLILNNTFEKKRIDVQERIDFGTQGIGAGITIQDSTLPDTTSSVKKFQSYGFQKFNGDGASFGFIAEFQNEFANKQNVVIDWRWMKDNNFFRRRMYDRYLAKSKNPNYFSYSRPLAEGLFEFGFIDSAREDFLSPARIPELEFSFPYISSGRFLGSFHFAPARFVDVSGNEFSRILAEAEFGLPSNVGYGKVSPFIRFRNIFYSQNDENINNFIFSPGINVQFLARKGDNNSDAVYFSPSFSIFSNFPSEKKTDRFFDFYDINPDGIFSELNLVWDFWRKGVRIGNITFNNHYDAKRTRFEDSFLMWNFNPGERWSFHGQERLNFSDGGIKEMINMVMFQDNDLRVGIGNRSLSGLFDGFSFLFNKRNKNWEFGMSLNYDFKNDKFTSQRFYLQRQFHCLTAKIMYSKTSTTSIGFVIIPSAFASSEF